MTNSTASSNPQTHRTVSGLKPIPFHGRLTIQTHIFLTGATGYIGGSVLTKLLSHPHSDAFQIVILVRSAEKAQHFRKMGIKVIVGSHADINLVQQRAAEADVVFACADADDLNAAKAILQGLKDRHERTGIAPALIHTSGTGILMDNAQGMYAGTKIYSDLDIPLLETLPRTQPHREVDMTLVEADEQGYVKTYIVLPGTIYGVATGPLIDLRVQNPHSQQLPRLVRVSWDRGRGGMVGQGKNIWPNVHIEDAANLYILLFDLVCSELATKIPAHGRAGFYFAENGEHTMYGLARAISRALCRMGRGGSTEPTTFTTEEMERYFPHGTSLGTNARCAADRARTIGWKPRRTLSDLLNSVQVEMDCQINRPADSDEADA